MKIDFESEKELEDFICDHYSETNEFIVDGSFPHHLFRQMDLGDYGIADLITITECRDGVAIGVFELKKENITAAAFEQVLRYATGVEALIKEAEPDLPFHVRPALVALNIDGSCFILNHSCADYYQVEFSPTEGVVFSKKSNGWVKTKACMPDKFASMAKQLYENQVMYKKRAAELKKDAEDAESTMPEEG